MKTIIVATNNDHKIKEIKEILDGFDFISLKDMGIEIDIEESGRSFEENALIKARAVYNLVNRPVLSDDSGLAVKALGGKPGIFSARYAGVHGDSNANNTKLLQDLQGVKDRRAEFICAVAFICEKGEFVQTGCVEGEILNEAIGEGGFGYDPLFFSYELNKSFALATKQEKNRVSHRARALYKIKQIIDNL